MEEDEQPVAGPSRRNSRGEGRRPSNNTPVLSWRNPQRQKSGDRNLRVLSWRNPQRQKSGDRNLRDKHVPLHRVTRKIESLVLEQLAEIDAHDVLVDVNKKKEAFFNLLNSPIERPDMYVLIMEVIAEVCDSSFEQLQATFLIEVCHSSFISNLENFLMNLQYAENKQDNPLYWDNEVEFWNNFIRFCDCIINVSPSIAKAKCRSLIEDVSRFCLEKLSEQHHFNLPEELNTKLIEIREKLNDEIKKIKSHKTVIVYDEENQPPEDFRDLSVVPTEKDLIDAQPFLRANVVNGPYRDVEHYLDVQFRLLREDFIGPLREGLAQYLNDQHKNKYDNIRVYRNVKFAWPSIHNQRFSSIIKVDSKTRRRFHQINWTDNKRFIFGSLVLLTKDNCKSFIAATILDITHIKYGHIEVEIVNPEIGEEIYNDELYTMIESEVYFEPYQLVMKALQDPKFPTHLAMKKYIVDVDTTPIQPTHIKEKSNYTVLVGSKDGNVTKTFNVLDYDMWPSKEELNLNYSQCEAYKLALTQEFVVIQGPPGTGKTFLAIKIAKTLLENVRKAGCKILLVCYTNHALDQFLEALIPFTKSIARIGGQSKNVNTHPYNLNFIRRHHEDRGIKETYGIEKQSLMFRISDCIKIQNALNHQFSVIFKYNYIVPYLVDNKVFLSIRNIHKNETHIDPLAAWLFENLIKDYNGTITENMLNENRHDESSAIFFCFSLKDSMDKEIRLVLDYRNETKLKEKNKLFRNISMVRAQRKLFSDMVECYKKNEHNINSGDDVASMSSYERWMLYFHWTEVVRPRMHRKIKIDMSRALQDFEESRIVLDYQLLKHKSVIGMTTTAAAKSRKLLQALGPPIVIVDEAAEVLEQHVITSLNRKCEHLILIGDHQQLRPSAAYVRLARHYNIEVSLFERMIMNNVHSQRLNVQHRMRPEIAELITPHIYPDLENNICVTQFPDVRGIKTNLFFFSHSFKEQEDKDSKSKSNPEEADLVLGLANYLMQQGYGADDVTVLAAYSGQMFYMDKNRRNYSRLSKVKITSVDNYQGEESKIILLSLVRNNDDNRIGFLSTENRVCVALSRAREGFYMFGNIDILKRNSKLWTTISDILEKRKHLGGSIDLICENHRTNPGVTFSCAADFNKVPEGGCLLKCNSQLSCGHFCTLFCHGYDNEHIEFKCLFPCERICKADHVCQKLCWEKCQPCIIRVSKEFPCGHTNEVYCHEDPNDERVHCYTQVEATLPDCGHTVQKPCYKDIENVSCTFPCEYRVDECGHAVCDLNCHVKNDRDHTKCWRPCARPKKGCSISLEDRGEHKCNKRCYEICDNCNVQVEKVVPGCNHVIKIECKLHATRYMCKNKCERALPCGHTCSGLCKDVCDPKTCKETNPTEFEAPCGHKVSLLCTVYQHFVSNGCVRTELLAHCRESCGALLSCEHVCAGTCGGCYQGRLHVACQERCQRINVCGHACTEPCNKVCPPCRKKCNVECVHSKCKKLCGEPCTPCKGPCVLSCEHGRCTRRCGEPCSRKPCTESCSKLLPCGHACRGFCGEPCPNICKVCRPDEFPKKASGYEHDEDAKFIVLKDCGHVLESEDMDNLMTSDQETVMVRTCPYCREPIINTHRYKDVIGDIFKTQINPVKQKVYGTEFERLETSKQIIDKIINLDTSLELFKNSLKKISVKVNTEAVRDAILIKLITVNRNLYTFIMENKNFDMIQLHVYDNYINIFVIVFDIFQKFYTAKLNTFESEFLAKISLICTYLHKNNKNLSQQQQKDLDNEVKRLNSIVNLTEILRYDLYKINKTFPSVQKTEKKAKSMIFDWRVFDNDKAVKDLIDFANSIGASDIVTALERATIA